MQYGDWTFYLACWAFVQIALLVASFADPHLRTLRKSRPWMWQALVLGLTTVALYGSDSNKPEPPKPPPKDTTPTIWVVKTEDGSFKVFQIDTNQDGSATTNELEAIRP